MATSNVPPIGRKLEDMQMEFDHVTGTVTLSQNGQEVVLDLGFVTDTLAPMAKVVAANKPAVD